MDESVPFSESLFSRNIEALNERDPELAAEILRYRPPEDVALVPLRSGDWVLKNETARLYRSSPNHPSASARALARWIWPEIRGLSAIAMGRIGAGYELREFLRIQEAHGERSPTFYVLVRDLLGVNAAFRLHDLSAAIADARLLIFAGERGLRRYANLLGDGLRPFPRRRLRIFGERPSPWDRAIAAVHRALEGERAEREREWAYALACAYAGFDPRTLPALWRERAARALVIASAGRAAETAEAIATGLEGAGVGAIHLLDGDSPSGATPCALALEIERFRPDLIIGVERFRPSIVARADRLPYVAWSGACASPDGFVFSSPTDFAVAHTPHQAAALAARGFLKENVFTLPPATDPRATLRPREEEGRGRARNVVLIDDLPLPSGTSAPEPAEEIASWLFEELPGVRIDLWGECWWARPSFRSSSRGELPSRSARSAIAAASAIFVHPRPEIDDDLLDALAAGALALIYSPSASDPIRRTFRDPEEVIFFADRRELGARARHALAHPEERGRIADRARRKILERWTFSLRCRELMEEVTARLRPARERAPSEPACVTG